jgi:hypothetical protein
LGGASARASRGGVAIKNTSPFLAERQVTGSCPRRAPGACDPETPTLSTARNQVCTHPPTHNRSDGERDQLYKHLTEHRNRQRSRWGRHRQRGDWMLMGCAGATAQAQPPSHKTPSTHSLYNPRTCAHGNRGLTGTATMIAGGTAEDSERPSTTILMAKKPTGHQSRGPPRRASDHAPLQATLQTQSTDLRAIEAQDGKPSASSLISTERQPRLWSQGGRPASEYPIGSTQNSHGHMHHHQH